MKKGKRSKRYSENAQLVVSDKIYSPSDAIELAKKTANTKFDGSLEVHVRLGIDIKKTDQQVRGTASLPYGTGKTLKIAAFVNEDQIEDAKTAGADIAGSEELILNLKKTGKIDFDLAVATPDMMPKLAVIAKILGPKGLMPSPKKSNYFTGYYQNNCGTQARKNKLQK